MQTKLLLVRQTKESRDEVVDVLHLLLQLIARADLQVIGLVDLETGVRGSCGAVQRQVLFLVEDDEERGYLIELPILQMLFEENRLAEVQYRRLHCACEI